MWLFAVSATVAMKQPPSVDAAVLSALLVSYYSNQLTRRYSSAYALCITVLRGLGEVLLQAIKQM